MESKTSSRRGSWSVLAWWGLLLAMWGVLVYWVVIFLWMNYYLDDMASFMEHVSDPAAKQLKSKWFDDHETDLVLYALPPLVIAILGALYLSLPRRPNTATWPLSKIWSSITGWPLVLPSPLPVMSLGEVFCYCLITLACAWGTWMWFLWGYQDAELQYREGTIQTKKEMALLKLEHNSGTIGWVSFFPFWLLFYPVTRHSVLLQLVGIQYEQAVAYHRWLGHATLLLGTIHSLLMYVAWIGDGKFYKVWEWQYESINNLAGSILFLVGLAIWITSIGPIRRKYFEVFFYTHHLYLLFILFYWLHVGPWALFYSFVPIVLFFLDRALRFLQSRREVSVVDAKVLPGNYISLDLPSTSAIAYPSSALVFVNLPALLPLEWHAFSVASTSATSPDAINVLAKPVGKWTNELAAMSPEDLKNIRVRVEGPYFMSNSNLLQRYDGLVLAAGGSGITPFLSVLRDLIYGHLNSNGGSIRLPTRVVLIWVVRHASELEVLDTLKLSKIDPSYAKNIGIKVRLFVTGEPGGQQQATALDLLPKANTKGGNIARSPSLSITPRIGGGSWLAELFLIVTVLTGTLFTILLFYRAIVYPYEHQTMAMEDSHDHDSHDSHDTDQGLKFSTYGRSLLYTFAQALGILVSTSVAVVAIAAVEKWYSGPLPTVQIAGSNGGEFSNLGEDDEAKDELHFASSLRHNAEVSFKGRPSWPDVVEAVCHDLDGIDSVGMFVSGPQGMQRSLALECQKRSVFSKARPHLNYHKFSFLF